MHTQRLPKRLRLLRLPAVIERAALSRSTIYRKISEGTFPAGIRISDQATAWLESEIDQWVAERIQESRSAAA